VQIGERGRWAGRTGCDALPQTAVLVLLATATGAGIVAGNSALIHSDSPESCLLVGSPKPLWVLVHTGRCSIPFPHSLSNNMDTSLWVSLSRTKTTTLFLAMAFS